jgi:ubiquitin carboxyl-terminal hydrolase L5
VKEEDSRLTLSQNDCPDLFYAKQVIQNACATQAILSVLMNSQGIELGSTLENFKSFVAELDYESKGLAIGNSDVMRQAHNSFSSQNSFESDAPRQREGKGDAFHFVAYVPFQGIVYELDGLKPGPIILGASSNDDDWLTVAKPAIEERMMRYSSSETSFALLNICPKRSLLLDAEIASKRSEVESLEAVLAQGPDEGVATMKANLLGGIAELLSERQEETYKLRQQQEENTRRRHDYLPFIACLLRHASMKGKLAPLIEAGRKRASESAARKSKK